MINLRTIGSEARPFVVGLLAVTVYILLSNAQTAFALDDLEFDKDRDPIARAFDLSRSGGYRQLDALSDRIGYKHQAVVEFQTDKNENVDSEDAENKSISAIEYDVAARYQRTKRLQFFGRVELAFERNARQDRPTDSDLALDLKTLYAQYLLPSGLSSLTVGRQELKDEREWLFDEELDGVGYSWAKGARGMVAFAGREELFRKNFLGEHEKDKQSLYYLRYYLGLGNRRQASLYGLYVDDRGFGDNERALILGARSYGRWSSGLDYWTEAAYVSGQQGNERHRGYGFDAGIAREFKKLDARPSVTLAIAYGSGARDGRAPTGFRQTGLQGNSLKLGGVVSVDRYGHVFEPELSNMVIATIGVGFRPEKNWSVNLLFHQYWQARLSDEIRDSNIDADPTGLNKTLGTGLDIVIGLRRWKNLSVEALFSAFWPGAAFDASATSARHAELLLKWKLP